MPVDVDVIMETEPSLSEREHYRSLALAAVSTVLRLEGREEDRCEVSVVFGDDDFIAGLNREYRDVAGPTDVLSFAMNEGEVGSGFISAESEPEMLGDIIVSVETAKRQAAEGKRSPDEEILLLIVHGTLHLLGYDHDTPEKEAVMWKLQGEALNALSER